MVGALLILCGAALLNAQPYAIDWYTIDGSGGTSSSGGYSVDGTIGQHAAGETMAGGNFSLTGGFWAAFAVQTPGAPLLSIERTNGVVRLFWPLPATGFVLEQAPAIGSPPAAISWSQVPWPYQTNATQIFITVPAPSGDKFYRLHRP